VWDLKKGDVVICVKCRDLYADSTFDLDFGKRYIVHSTFVPYHIEITTHPDEEYINFLPTIRLNYSLSRFIHENDWIRRLKYGV